MKIRIKENSIRFRLTKSEVHKFIEQGFFQMSTEFPDGSVFYYAIEIATVPIPVAEFDQSEIKILVPQQIAEEWSSTELVGIEQFSDLKSGKRLRILIEKDFMCLDDRLDEDESDNYDNPKR